MKLERLRLICVHQDDMLKLATVKELRSGQNALPLSYSFKLISKGHAKYLSIYATKISYKSCLYNALSFQQCKFTVLSNVKPIIIAPN